MWFALEDGESYQRQEKYGLALKRFHTIWKVAPTLLQLYTYEQHFEDWEEDQYDFHTYSLRKGPIRDYIKLLSWEDRLRSHPYFVRAARNAIAIYIHLHDDPRLASGPPEVDGINDAEKKKAAKKAKKAAKKAEEQANAAAAAAATGDQKDAKKDEDPKGEKLVKTDKPLEEAVRFLKPLQEFSPNVIETQLLAFDVHFRRGLSFALTVGRRC